jgi:hypothetical protein
MLPAAAGPEAVAPAAAFALFLRRITVYPGDMKRNLTPGALGTAILVALLLGLGGCGGQVPGFLGREGDADPSFSLDPEALPPPVPVPVRAVRADRGAQGIIVRAEAVAPVQGYHTAALVGDARGLDAAGYLNFQFVAIPPETAEAVGPERTRILHGVDFIPNRALRNVNGVRVTGAGGASASAPIP